MRHFAYWTVRLMDSSPIRQFTYDMDISLHDISPPITLPDRRNLYTYATMFDKQAQFNYTVFQKTTTIFMVVIL